MTGWCRCTRCLVALPFHDYQWRHDWGKNAVYKYNLLGPGTRISHFSVSSKSVPIILVGAEPIKNWARSLVDTRQLHTGG